MERIELLKDFCIHVEFDPKAPNPERVFESIAFLIKAFQTIDQHLITCIDSKIEPILVLEDIERGSIKVWIAQTIRKIPDTALKDGEWKKVLGCFLVEGKHSILNFLEKNNTIQSEGEIISLEEDIKRLAEKTNISQLNCYSQISRSHLISDLNNVTNAVKPLAKSDHVRFLMGENVSVNFNPNFEIPEGVEELLLASESIVNTTEMILKIKKPDFLGESQWSFKFGNKNIDAKIQDEEWLQDFRNRVFNLGPGDSIRAKVKSVAVYGKNYEVIDEKHSVVKVIEILRSNGSTPGILFPPK